MNVHSTMAGAGKSAQTLLVPTVVAVGRDITCKQMASLVAGIDQVSIEGVREGKREMGREREGRGGDGEES